jgi:hypothetical protein
MRIRTSLTAVAVAATAVAAAACATPPASGSGTTTTLAVHTVDQQYFAAADRNAAADAAACSPSLAPYVAEVAQTFTAGRTGTLDQVSLTPSRISGTAPAPLAITIQTVTAEGKPSGTAIGSGSYDGPANSLTLQDMPLSTPAHVVSGTVYAIVAAESACATPAPDNGWTFDGHGSSTDAYPGGQGWTRLVGSPSDWHGPGGSTALDLFFATWIR